MTESEFESSWEPWRQFTAARVGLRRSGGSIGTKDLLRFRLDHAKARDAVWGECDWPFLLEEIKNITKLVQVKSRVQTKQEYLLRPDLGRKLDQDSERFLEQSPLIEDPSKILICASDGLSATALNQNLIPLLLLLCQELKSRFQFLPPVVLVERGRVAIGDEVASRLQKSVLIMLIGERPGLSSVDSLGAYLTFQPKPGYTDESRNCISNIRPEGMALPMAVKKIAYLVEEMLLKKISGVQLKDRMEASLEEKEIKKLNNL
ncbi:ethanolamine ammonia-lyase, light subunit [Leptospira ryugenii]|uniref:Ethanolamine ammonia-lyase small subunit n=1 Tax=Leptospira ryugenii TaxID=1917863 RepID=A0A2P2E1W2_9LEPT|nr:ethanolamine ammonia-lyase subunit EutC [Leptospira ryugenii]GBF50882.1 ethanolamine ammonia-lyase, light subunit [Leptospira ryugenii]